MVVKGPNEIAAETVNNVNRFIENNLGINVDYIANKVAKDISDGIDIVSVKSAVEMKGPQIPAPLDPDQMFPGMKKVMGGLPKPPSPMKFLPPLPHELFR